MYILSISFNYNHMKKKLSGYRLFLFDSNNNAYCYLPYKHVVLLLPIFFSVLFYTCNHKDKRLPNQAMIDLLKQADEKYKSPDNIFCPEAVVKLCDSILEN